MKLVILKLGGSVIAPKGARRPFLREKLLSEIARALKKSLGKKNFQLIIIHGGGSFCHPLAKRFDIGNGTRGDREKEVAAEKVSEICRNLSRRVSSILAKHLPVILVDTPTIIKNDEGKLFSLERSFLEKILRKGNIPVLSGQVVPDETLDWSIASGDQLAAALAGAFEAETVYFASDVNGIFEEDPHVKRNAKHIETIPLRALEKSSFLTGAAYDDATGGMFGKFLPFFDAKHASMKSVHVFDGKNIDGFSGIGKDPFPFGTTVTK